MNLRKSVTRPEPGRMRFDGKLSSWNDEKGYGFIAPCQGGQEIFVHIKSFPAGTGRPAVGLALSFEVELGPQGKKRARAVEFIRDARPARVARTAESAPWTLPRLLVLPAFAGIYAYVASRWPVSLWVPAAYLLASLIAFHVYATDKWSARDGTWRISEATLHFWSLACGWPGALLAQQLYRHKTAKKSFIAGFWLTIFANVLGFVGWHWPGARMLLA